MVKSNPDNWDIAEAGKRLREVVERAQRRGPQMLTVEGAEVAAVISPVELKLLKERQPTLKEMLLSTNLEGVDLERDQTPTRDIDL